MIELEKYVRKNHVPSDLFSQREFTFEKSSSSRLIQCADFISGTLARYYDKDKKSPEGGTFLQKLHPQIVALREWPRSDRSIIDTLSSRGFDFDELITTVSLGTVGQYLNTHENKRDPEIALRVDFLRLLRLTFDVNPSRWLPTREAIAHLEPLHSILAARSKGARGPNIARAERYIRQHVVAPLRDTGVLIASSNKGYKIPTTERNCTEFIERISGSVLPMIGRVCRFRDRLFMASKGDLDVLENSELSVIADQYKKLGSLEAG